MCAVSAVFDHFSKREWPGLGQQGGGLGYQQFWPTIQALTNDELTALRQMLKDFYEAKAAAERVDELTAQKDCVDPDKAKLLERIEALETALLSLKKPAPKKRAKRAKKARP